MDPYIFVIVLVAIVFGSITSMVQSSQKRKGKKNTALSDEETKIMQEIHQSLIKMEKRVEALETIIINKK